MKKICLWCLKNETETKFQNKAHTVPLSLGGDKYNRNVCDSCNTYFGTKQEYKYSIEEALKEGFNITRKRFLTTGNQKKKTGRFKSKFFEIKEKNGKYRLIIKPSFRFNSGFQQTLCRAFKRGLYKMFLEELNRQKGLGFEKEYNIIRDFARNDIDDLPMIYFNRKIGIIAFTESEAATPILMFDRMNYLYSNEYFVEIEFLGHVFGFPITDFDLDKFKVYLKKSLELKKDFFTSGIIINKLTDIDLALNIMNDKKTAYNNS